MLFIVLDSGAQRSDSVTHRCVYNSIFSLKFFFPLVYYKIINIIDWAIQSISKDMKKSQNFTNYLIQLKMGEGGK